METLLTIILPALSALVVAIVMWLLRKVGLSPELTVRAHEIVKMGIDHAEDMALTYAGKYKGPQKLQLALNTINKLAKENPKLTEYLSQNGADLVEKLLVSRLTSEEVTPRVVKN